MLSALLRKAAEDCLCDSAGMRGDLGDDGADRDARGKVRWKSVNAGGDRRIGDGSEPVTGREVERRAITTRQKRLLVLVAATPDRTHRVNNVARPEPITLGDFGRARFAAA